MPPSLTQGDVIGSKRWPVSLEGWQMCPREKRRNNLSNRKLFLLKGTFRRTQSSIAGDLVRGGNILVITSAEEQSETESEQQSDGQTGPPDGGAPALRRRGTTKTRRSVGKGSAVI
ncbi:uncharacterized protein AB9W97_011384 [Spinachia spinachia]